MMKHGFSILFCATIAFSAGIVWSSPTRMPLSPSDMTAALEQKIVSGMGFLYPGSDLESATTPALTLLDDSWPDAFLARIGETISVRVSPVTGCYEFSDESGSVFWIEVPVIPSLSNWVASFLYPSNQPIHDTFLLAPWHVADRWRLSTETLEINHRSSSLLRSSMPQSRSKNSIVSNLCFTSFRVTETNLSFTAAWPTNEPLPGCVLDLYCSTNGLTRFPFLLSSQPATNSPVSFEIPSALVPNWNCASSHVHDALCPAVTNTILSPLDGTTVYTNIVYGCPGSVPASESTFFRLGSRLDTDGDGLSDAYECFVTFTDEHNADSDWDGLSDGAEWSLEVDPLLRDTDGDGLVDGIDPDPFNMTNPEDANGNGITDAIELHWFGALDASLNPVTRDTTGFTLAAKIAAGLCPTNTPFVANVSTNGIEAVQLVPSFGIEGTTNGVLWEKTISINRHGAWEQYFVSSDPNPARDRSDGIGDWMLDGLRLDWADSTGASGSAVASPDCAPLHLPVSTNAPAWIRLRLVATRATLAICPQPLYFLTYVPTFTLPNLPSAKQGTVHLAASSTCEEVYFEIDRSTRPTWEGFLPGEAEALPFETPASATLDIQFGVDLSTGTLVFAGPGVFSIPQIEYSQNVSLQRVRHVAPVAREFLLTILAPNLSFGISHTWSGTRGIDWDGSSWSRVLTSSYPLDAEWLWRSFRCNAMGGFVCDCEPELTLGDCEVEAYRDWFAINISVDGDTAEAAIGLDDSMVWTGTAMHEWQDWGGLDASLDNTCGCGGADELEGPSHASLGFRIPLGIPRAAQVSGFLWFHTTDPISLSLDSLQLLVRSDAAVTDTTSDGVRTIACSDTRGRTLVVSNIVNGVRIVVVDTASDELEHIWDLVNENGSTSRIRLMNTSRLGNTISEAVFVHDGADWHLMDPIANTLETLQTENNLDDPWDPFFIEKRVLTDATDTNLVYSHTLSTFHRFGDLLRETERVEDAGTPFEKHSYVTYWENGGRRMGLPRLSSGNSRAWSWSNYDTLGRPTIRFDQLDGSECPGDSTGYTLQNPPRGCAATATISDYTPLAGDSNDRNDLDAVRTQSRYRLTDGATILVARTWNVYARTTTNGWPVVVIRTERASSQIASFGNPSNAVSITVSIDPDADGVPLLLRGRPLVFTDENGVTTSYDYAFGSWNHDTHTFVEGTSTSHLRTRRLATSPEAPAGIPLVSTISELVVDATHGVEVWTATRVLLLDGSLSAPFDWQARVYDNKDRLRSTLYSDGSFSTNAYSCCRLLFTIDRNGMKRERLADTGTDHLHHAWLDVSFPSLPQNEWRNHEYHYAEPGAYDYQRTYSFRAVESHFDPLGREIRRRTFATEPNRSQSISSLQPSNHAWDISETNLYPHGTSDHRIRINVRGLRTETTVTHNGTGTETMTAEIIGTNLISKTVSRCNFGGSFTTRREWGGKWTRSSTASTADSDGSRIDYTILEYSDAPAITNSVTFSDFLGRTTRVVTPLSDTTYAYNGASARVLSATDIKSGLSTAPLYNALRQTVGSVSADVASLSTVRYEIDASNTLWRVSEEREAAGDSTNLLSTVRERLTGLSNALQSETHIIPTGCAASTTTVSFNPDTLVSVETNLVGGRMPIIRRSKFGRMIETQERDGTIRKHFFDPYGRPYLMGETPPGGSFIWRTWTCRDALGDTIADIEVTARNLAEIGLATNRVSSLYNPGSAAWSGFVTEHDYDIRGNLVASRDEEANETIFERDGLGRLIGASGATCPMFRSLDATGHLIALGTTRDTHAWDVTIWAYDHATGLCTNKTYADGSTIVYAFDAAGRPTRTTLASGRWTQTAYDAFGRLAAETRSDSTSVQYAYDAFGRLAALAEGNGRAESFARDALGRITNETQSASGLVASLDRPFDAFGRLAGYRLEIDGDLAQAVCYDYGMDGLMDTITLTNTQGRSVSVSYDWSQGRFVGYTISGNAGVPLFERTQTRASRRPTLVTAVTNAGATVRSFAYAYDAVGHPVIRDADTYAYNARNEVTNVTISSHSYGYAYDYIGNRTYATDAGAMTTYAANALNQYTTIDSWTPSYDADGNLLGDRLFGFTWDAAGQLASVTNSSKKLEFVYDWKGRRTHLAEYQRNGTAWTLVENRTFVYDNWNLIYEQSERPGEIAVGIAYFWGPDLSGALQGAGGVGGLVAVSIDGTFYFPGYDNNGNVIGYWDESGSLVAEYAYDAFGNLLSSVGSMASVFPHRFSTKYHDAATDLYYYGYRYYSPSLGRWIHRDALGESGGLNLQAFCENGPSFAIDGLGQTSVSLEKDISLPEFGPQYEILTVVATITDPPPSNGKINFIQLKRNLRSAGIWELDNKAGSSVPYYLDKKELSLFTAENESGKEVVTFVDSPRGAHGNDVDFALFVVETTSKCCLKYVGNPNLFPNPILTCTGQLRVLAARDWKFLHNEQRIVFKNEPSQRLSYVFPELKRLIESRQWVINGLVFGNMEVINDK